MLSPVHKKVPVFGEFLLLCISTPQHPHPHSCPPPTLPRRTVAHQGPTPLGRRKGSHCCVRIQEVLSQCRSLLPPLPPWGPGPSPALLHEKQKVKASSPEFLGPSTSVHVTKMKTQNQSKETVCIMRRYSLQVLPKDCCIINLSDAKITS